MPAPALVHTGFDLLAWLSAWLMARQVARRGFLATALRRPSTDPDYFIALGLGAIAGAILFGSVNMSLAGFWQLGHSVAGAIAGGVVGVELFKWLKGIRGSTGAQFAAPLATGIAVGRLGCFFAGLPDYTYGVATSLPWGVDFGDGVSRHPVQIYEALSMSLFVAVYWRALARGSAFFKRDGFYLFVAYYAAQRFAWEFLKPYPAVIGPLNLFHILCAALFSYAILMMRLNHDLRPARARL